MVNIQVNPICKQLLLYEEQAILKIRTISHLLIWVGLSNVSFYFFLVYTIGSLRSYTLAPFPKFLPFTKRFSPFQLMVRINFASSLFAKLVSDKILVYWCQEAIYILIFDDHYAQTVCRVLLSGTNQC